MVQKGARSFDMVNARESSKGSKKVQGGSRRIKKVQVVSGWFELVQEGSSKFKKVFEG